MILNILFILLIPLLFTGTINRFKAVWAGRRGAPIWQPISDTLRLFKKDEVLSSSSTFIFDISPAISLAACLAASIFVPFNGIKAITSFEGDIIVFAYLLAMAKFFSVLAAMDTASSFEGMGASRELSFTIFIEPALFIIFAVIAFGSGIGSIGMLISSVSSGFGDPRTLVFAILIALSLFIILLIEGCRVPFDDPNTHLELTMIHEVMILDHSGTNLAYATFGAALKMCIYAALMINIFLPKDLTLYYKLAAMPIGFFVCALGVALIESLMARFRMNRNLELAIIPLVIALLILAAALTKHLGAM